MTVFKDLNAKCLYLKALLLPHESNCLSYKVLVGCFC